MLIILWWSPKPCPFHYIDDYISVWHIIGILNSLEHIICILCCVVIVQKYAVYSAPSLITKWQEHKILLYIGNRVWFPRHSEHFSFTMGNLAKHNWLFFNSLIIKDHVVLASEKNILEIINKFLWISEWIPFLRWNVLLLLLSQSLCTSASRPNHAFIPRPWPS